MTSSALGQLRNRGVSGNWEEMRLQIRKKLLEMDELVNLDALSEHEKHIYFLHKIACWECHFTYDDPKSKLKVFTSYRHLSRGQCCGSACRHCPYGHEAVFNKNRKTFNTAFYIN